MSLSGTYDPATGSVQIANDDGTGAVTITGLDLLPDRGGPSTNLSLISPRVLLIYRPGCDIPLYTLRVNQPYGGLTWVAAP